MKKVFKYLLQVADEQTVMLPNNAIILTASVQKDLIYLYALVDESQESSPLTIQMSSTGQEIKNPEELTYISTVQFVIGALVFHLFIKN